MSQYIYILVSMFATIESNKSITYPTMLKIKEKFYGLALAI